MALWRQFKKVFLSLFLLVFVFIPANALLAAPPDFNYNDPKTPEGPGVLVMFLQLLLGLAVIVGLAFIIIRLMRKQIPAKSTGDAISVLDQYAFGLNKGLFITEIAGKVYVLGITDHSINVISEITDQDLIDEMKLKAMERHNEPVIPQNIIQLARKIFNEPGKPKVEFKTHIQDQVQKLQNMFNKTGQSRKDDHNE